MASRMFVLGGPAPARAPRRAAQAVLQLGGVSISLVPLGLLLGFWVSFGSIAEVLERGRVGRVEKFFSQLMAAA